MMSSFTPGSSNGSLRIRWEDMYGISLLLRSCVPGEWKFCGELFPTSFFWRSISRELRMGLTEENGTCEAGFTSVACWRSRPYGRDHIDLTVRGSGTDTTSPVANNCQRSESNYLSSCYSEKRQIVLINQRSSQQVKRNKAIYFQEQRKGKIEINSG